MTLPAPAKVNLFLHVTGQRSDGMRNLQTVFQLLDYCDFLRFRDRSDGEINIQCDADIPTHDNTVYRAVSLLRKRAGIERGVDIEIQERIPVGSGLGGGSSDAATALHGLNRLWRLGYSSADLMEIGLVIGADVPVFIMACSAWAEGVGEDLTPLDLPHQYFTVFVPPLSVSTREMFMEPALERNCKPLDHKCYRVGDGSNVFQPIVSQRYPEIASDIAWLSDFAEVRLSGTGSAFFAMFEDEGKARSLFERRLPHLDGFVARGLSQSPIRLALKA